MSPSSLSIALTPASGLNLSPTLIVASAGTVKTGASSLGSTFCFTVTVCLAVTVCPLESETV